MYDILKTISVLENLAKGEYNFISGGPQMALIRLCKKLKPRTPYQL